VAAGGTEKNFRPHKQQRHGELDGLAAALATLRFGKYTQSSGDRPIERLTPNLSSRSVELHDLAGPFSFAIEVDFNLGFSESREAKQTAPPQGFDGDGAVRRMGISDAIQHKTESALRH
jgi:hypothetical protein